MYFFGVGRLGARTYIFTASASPFFSVHHGDTMAKKAPTVNLIVKLIVGAGQATPSPPVGPALGSKGVKSMDFCKVRSSPPSLTTRREHNYFHRTPDTLIRSIAP